VRVLEASGRGKAERECVAERTGEKNLGVHVSGTRFLVVWAGLLTLGRVGEGEGERRVQDGPREGGAGQMVSKGEGWCERIMARPCLREKKREREKRA
jgi:hypothetical protein